MKTLDGVIVGAILMFVGIASIPFAYGFGAEHGFSFYLTLFLIVIQMIPIGIGLFLVYNALRFNRSVADKIIDNAPPGNITDSAPNMPRRIEITINDNGIELSTWGMSPQEIISSLELTKYYVLSKHVSHGSPIDVVRRK